MAIGILICIDIALTGVLLFFSLRFWLRAAPGFPGTPRFEPPSGGKPVAEETPAPASPSETAAEAEKIAEMMRREEEAFRQLMGYNAQLAYGEGKGLDGE